MNFYDEERTNRRYASHVAAPLPSHCENCKKPFYLISERFGTAAGYFCRTCKTEYENYWNKRDAESRRMIVQDIVNILFVAKLKFKIGDRVRMKKGYFGHSGYIHGIFEGAAGGYWASIGSKQNCHKCHHSSIPLWKLELDNFV